MNNHSLEHLKKVKSKIIDWPIEKQAEYADEICIENINDIEFIKEQMDAVNINDKSVFKTFNTTSIGNLAYLVLNAPKEYAGKAKNILENYKSYKSK